MDKKKNRADPLAAGRQKLQQFRQKKADKNTDHKKDSKGSTSKGKSSKKSGKSEKPEKIAVSDEAEAPSAGGATSYVKIDEEVVDSPQTSADALSQEYVLVHGSSSEPDMKRIDSTAAGAVDSLTSEHADSEKGVTHDDASVIVDGVFAASGNLAVGEGVEVESGSGNVEKPLQPFSSPEFIPDVSLSGARGDQVTDVGEMQEDSGLHKEQLSEASSKADVDWVVTEERQASYPAVVDSSASPSHFSEGSSVAFDSVEMEGITGKIRSQQIREAAEEPRKKDTSNPSGEVSAAHVHEGRAVSFLQLMEIVQGLGRDEFQMLCTAREAASCTDPGTSLLERLREELFVSSTMKDILHVQLTEQSHLQSEFDHQHNQLVAEISQLRVSYNALTDRNESLVEELSECQSNLYAATSSNEKFENQLLAREAQVDAFAAKMNELQSSLEKSLLDLSEAKEKLINLQVENDVR